MKTKLPPLSEKQIQQACIGYLWAKGYYVQRMNSGKIRTDKGHLVNLSTPGTPDILAFKQQKTIKEYIDSNAVYLLFVEVKAPGNKPTILQTAKMKELEEYGARCIVAYDVQDLIDANI